MLSNVTEVGQKQKNVLLHCCVLGQQAHYLVCDTILLSCLHCDYPLHTSTPIVSLLTLKNYHLLNYVRDLKVFTLTEWFL